MIAGGFDDISEEGSYEFANMKATSNAETEFAMGREPTEMSRPGTTTRAGVCRAMQSERYPANHWLQFMESQGTGIHIVMSAKTALELGAPIRGVLAFTSTSTCVTASMYLRCMINCYSVIRRAGRSLHLDVALSPSLENYPRAIHYHLSASTTAPDRYRSDVSRSLNGLVMNTLNYGMKWKLLR